MCLRPHCGQWVRTVYWAPNFVVSSHAGDDFISLFPKLLIPAVILESLLLSNSGPMGITKIALAASPANALCRCNAAQRVVSGNENAPQKDHYCKTDHHNPSLAGSAATQSSTRTNYSEFFVRYGLSATLCRCNGYYGGAVAQALR